MNINEKRDEIVKACLDKFPKQLTLEDRYINLTDQVATFGKKLQAHQGKVFGRDGHDTIEQCVAATLIELFMISGMLNVDFEKELDEALRWFRTGTK